MIELERVSKFYGPHAAVRDLSLTIEKGQCVGLLGLNGAGKTTTLQMLAGLVAPTAGTIRVRGVDIVEDPTSLRRSLGYLPDRPPLYDEMKVGAYLRFVGELRGMTKSELTKRVPEVVERCALSDVVDAPISTLSHGYRQRVGIAQAIVHNPSLLILDEPIQGLDPLQIVEMRERIRSLRGEHTILLSTHVLSEVRQTCDRLAVIHEGQLAAEGTEDELSGLGPFRVAAPAHRNQFSTRLGARVRVQVQAPEDADVLRHLETIDGVESAKEGVRGIEVHGGTDVRAAVAKAVVEGGLAIASP